MSKKSSAEIAYTEHLEGGGGGSIFLSFVCVLLIILGGISVGYVLFKSDDDS